MRLTCTDTATRTPPARAGSRWGRGARTTWSRCPALCPAAPWWSAAPAWSGNRSGRSERSSSQTCVPDTRYLFSTRHGDTKGRHPPGSRRTCRCRGWRWRPRRTRARSWWWPGAGPGTGPGPPSHRRGCCHCAPAAARPSPSSCHVSPVWTNHVSSLLIMSWYVSAAISWIFS